LRNVCSRTDPEVTTLQESPIAPKTPPCNLDINIETAIRPADAIPPGIKLCPRRRMPPGAPKKRTLTASNLCEPSSVPVKLDAPNEIAEISGDDWRYAVRTRSQLRQLLDFKKDPTPSTTPKPTPPKRPLSKVDRKNPKSDPLPISSTIKAINLASAQTDDGRNNDSNGSEIGSGENQEKNRPTTMAEDGIDSRYDPTVVEIKDGTFLVPHSCYRFFPVANF
jgi:hypothetical protein